jgi:NADH:ubiquinone oxidoreductase subunit 2 (subunit N)
MRSNRKLVEAIVFPVVDIPGVGGFWGKKFLVKKILYLPLWFLAGILFLIFFDVSGVG